MKYSNQIKLLLFNAKLANFQLYHDEAYSWFKSIFTVNIYFLFLLIICRKFIYVAYNQRRKRGWGEGVESGVSASFLKEPESDLTMQALEEDWKAGIWGQTLEVDWKRGELQERAGKWRGKFLKVTSKKKKLKGHFILLQKHPIEKF